MTASYDKNHHVTGYTLTYYEIWWVNGPDGVEAWDGRGDCTEGTNWGKGKYPDDHWTLGGLQGDCYHGTRTQHGELMLSGKTLPQAFHCPGTAGACKCSLNSPSTFVWTAPPSFIPDAGGAGNMTYTWHCCGKDGDLCNCTPDPAGCTDPDCEVNP